MQKEEESGHTAAIKLAPWRNLVMTDEITMLNTEYQRLWNEKGLVWSVAAIQGLFYWLEKAIDSSADDVSYLVNGLGARPVWYWLPGHSVIAERSEAERGLVIVT